MFFILSKALLFIISPFFWLALCGGFALFLKGGKWKRRMKWTTLGLFLFFSNSVIFSEYCLLWEVPGKKVQDVGQYDVGIVLGGMFDYDNQLDRLSIRRPGDRLIQTITLYKKGKIKKILISGDSGFVTERGLHEAKQVKDLLITWGIPSSDILTEEISKNTYENATECSKVLKKHPEYKSFLLITSGMHMRRSMACFDRAGIQCESYSTDIYSNTSGGYQWDQYLIPNVSNFVEWHKLLKEIIGYVVYDLRGYI